MKQRYLGSIQSCLITEKEFFYRRDGISAEDWGFQMLRVFPLSLVGTVGGRNLRITDLYKSSLHWSNNVLGEGPQWALNLPFVFSIPIKLSRE